MRDPHYLPTPEQIRARWNLEPATRGELERAEARIMLRLDLLFTELTGRPPLSSLVTQIDADTKQGGEL